VANLALVQRYIMAQLCSARPQLPQSPRKSP